MFFLERVGLTKHDVSDLAHEFGIRHAFYCRQASPKGGGRAYVCICDFFAEIIRAAWRSFDMEMEKNMSHGSHDIAKDGPPPKWYVHAANSGAMRTRCGEWLSGNMAGTATVLYSDNRYHDADPGVNCPRCLSPTARLDIDPGHTAPAIRAARAAGAPRETPSVTAGVGASALDAAAKIETMTVPCSRCNGRGEVNGGRGELGDGERSWDRCPKCEGKGKVPKRPDYCPKCRETYPQEPFFETCGACGSALVFKPVDCPACDAIDEGANQAISRHTHTGKDRRGRAIPPERLPLRESTDDPRRRSDEILLDAYIAAKDDGPTISDHEIETREAVLRAMGEAWSSDRTESTAERDVKQVTSILLATLIRAGVVQGSESMSAPDIYAAAGRFNSSAHEELSRAEDLARFFHETYERLAPSFDYSTRKASAVPWAIVPENNRRLMVEVARAVLARSRAIREVGVAQAKKILSDLMVDPQRWRDGWGRAVRAAMDKLDMLSEETGTNIGRADAIDPDTRNMERRDALAQAANAPVLSANALALIRSLVSRTTVGMSQQALVNTIVEIRRLVTSEPEAAVDPHVGIGTRLAPAPGVIEAQAEKLKTLLHKTSETEMADLIEKAANGAENDGAIDKTEEIALLTLAARLRLPRESGSCDHPILHGAGCVCGKVARGEPPYINRATPVDVAEADAWSMNAALPPLDAKDKTIMGKPPTNYKGGACGTCHANLMVDGFCPECRSYVQGALPAFCIVCSKELTRDGYCAKCAKEHA